MGALRERDRLVLANFALGCGCSGPQPELTRLAKAGFLRHTRTDGLHEHYFSITPEGEVEAERIRVELAPEVLNRLSAEAQAALGQRRHHVQLEVERLAGRKGGGVFLTPLGRAVVDLLTERLRLLLVLSDRQQASARATSEAKLHEAAEQAHPGDVGRQAAFARAVALRVWRKMMAGREIAMGLAWDLADVEH